MPSPQAEGPPLVGCPQLLIQYIRSYTPYLEAISSIRNLRTRHALVTRDPLNMDLYKANYCKRNWLSYSKGTSITSKRLCRLQFTETVELIRRGSKMYTKLNHYIAIC
jgi:hypothetical protein